MAGNGQLRLMKTALQHMEAAVAEVEATATAGHISPEEASEAIEKLRLLHERLSRLERKLDGGQRIGT